MASGQKPTWEKSSAELVALFEELVRKDPAVTKKKMFGWPCCFVNGNLFTGLHKESMIFRLSDGDRLAFLRLDGATDFEPMAGHKMGGYVIVPGNWRAKPPSALIKRALEITRKMPAKTPKKKAAAKR